VTVEDELFPQPRMRAGVRISIEHRSDVGASVMKNQTPRNPSFGRRASATAVDTSRRTRKSA
jgi:hypothetical protein